MSQGSAVQSALERNVGTWLFRARWLLLPIYAGLAVALAGLVVVFVKEVVDGAAHLFAGEPKHAIVTILELVDVSLAANLLVIVILSGYENFVARIDTASTDRPSWMGAIGFSGMKLKLMGSIVAISGIAVLRVFAEMYEDNAQIDDRVIAWLLGGHLAFVVSGVLLALMDYIASKTPPQH